MNINHGLTATGVLEEFGIEETGQGGFLETLLDIDAAEAEIRQTRERLQNQLLRIEEGRYAMVTIDETASRLEALINEVCVLERMAKRWQRMTAKFPEVEVSLVGKGGNAFGVISAVRDALRKNGCSEAQVAAFTDHAMSEDYDHLLATAQQWVTVV